MSCTERQRNVQIIITHVHSHCSVHLFFCSVTFPLPLPWWFRKLPNVNQITQVKIKIAYHLINSVKKFKYRRGIINKQFAKVSGMCDIPNSSYSAKGITEIYSV